MSYLALYRRYRPKNFHELIGQKPIIQTLTNALLTKRISHAYLFCGQRGTGKTTIARLFAKALNCENRKENEFEPCNQCQSCIEINENRSLDLIEIDAASNRGIDEIRNLKDGIRFAPIKSKYKVFIIDEVHMLTKEAFNALLKTLEEPPAHAIFILATTEPEKLPATIISRTQRFDFKKLSINEIMERLKKLSESENITITAEALKEIALAAEGSLRDAESLLDQLISLGYKEIDLDVLEEILGHINFEKVAEFLNYLLEKDAKNALIFINKIYENGVDLINFGRLLLKILRQILLLKINPQIENIIKDEFTPDQFIKIQSFSQKFSLNDLHKIIDLLIRIKEQIKYSPIPTLPLELIIIQYCEGSK